MRRALLIRLWCTCNLDADPWELWFTGIISHKPNFRDVQRISIEGSSKNQIRCKEQAGRLQPHPILCYKFLHGSYGFIHRTTKSHSRCKTKTIVPGQRRKRERKQSYFAVSEEAVNRSLGPIQTQDRDQASSMNIQSLYTFHSAHLPRTLQLTKWRLLSTDSTQ